MDGKMIKKSFRACAAAAAMLLAGLSCQANASAEVIGSYSNGCLARPAVLKSESPYYQIARSYRERFYGHESLIAFLERYSKKMHGLGIDSVLIGDLSKNGGGRIPGTHASHQNGLDVDIPFQTRRIPRKDLKNGNAEVLVGKDVKKVNAQFNKKYYLMIMTAARDPEVERIFVAPAIKLAVLDMADESDLKALSKIRPWYGHTEHMHVRLACPKDSPDCERQPRPPVLSFEQARKEANSWFLPPPPKKPGEHKKKPAEPKPLHPRCAELVRQSQDSGKHSR